MKPLQNQEVSCITKESITLQSIQSHTHLPPISAQASLLQGNLPRPPACRAAIPVIYTLTAPHTSILLHLTYLYFYIICPAPQEWK